MADEKKAEEDISDEELDRIIEDIAEDDAPQKKAPLSLVEGDSVKRPKAENEQALTMELKGVIHLKLCFTSGERAIELTCTEDALLCRMADGTEFRVPTGVAPAKRESA